MFGINCPNGKEKSCSHVGSWNTQRIRRREILLAGVAAGLSVEASLPLAASQSSDRVESRPSDDAKPDTILKYLYAGNDRFAAGKPTDEHRSIERIRQFANKQKPLAAILGCADSRVPVEIVFDQGFGDLFVTRIAGNIATSENIGSLEFGTLILGAKVLFVLGHTNCGAVTATIQANEVPGQISGLFQHIRPAAKEAKGDLAKAVELNVRNQATTLAESSPVIARLIREKKLIIAGGVYDLSSGKVTPVELQLNHQ
jgi:carbonic anhydrase